MKNTEATPTTAQAKYEAFMEDYKNRHLIGGTARAWKVAKDKAEAALKAAR